MSRKCAIEQGVLKIDGRPTFVWSADYPYYRDQRADWPKQLDNLKKMNVNVVTFYIPWRHHAPTDPLKAGGAYDFVGKLNDRTDVLEFIRLIHERGMFCVVKPGPYIHAETRFGSLPDYVLPDNNPEIHLRVDMQGNASPACWGFPNPPAPMDSAYLRYVADWFEHVAREVIAPNEYPNGPIVAVQVLNEGIYSDGGHGIDKIHFDAPALAHYRSFLQDKYGSISNYNTLCCNAFGSFEEIPPPKPWSSKKNRAEILPWIDWGEFGQYFYRKIAATYIGYLTGAGVTLPMVMNINPPASPRGAGLELVMGRYTVPYLTPVISYGYTNWCGVVSHNEDAYLKYKIVGKSARGINMEENWGFDSYDPPYYWSVQPSYFQSMAYMLWGATGLNIYLGVSCDCWTDHLAVDAGGVYMHNHPIAEDGSYRESFWTCQQMGALMKNVGNDLVMQDLHEPVAWAFYSPYAHAASWDSSPQDWKRIGFPDRPHAAWFGWDSFMALCDKSKTQNGICYPREEPVERLLRHKALFIDGNSWMDADTQAKLVEYVRQGGVLVLTSSVPELDEFFRPCTILRDELFRFEIQLTADDGGFGYSLAGADFSGTGRGPLNRVTGLPDGWSVLAEASTHGHTVPCGAVHSLGKGKAIFLGFSPWQTESGDWGSTGLVEHLARQFAGVRTLCTIAAEPKDRLVETAEFRCDESGRRHCFVLTRRDKPSSYHVVMTDFDGRAESFKLQLPSFSAAFAGFEDGRIISAFIKGYNDLDKSSARPYLEFGADVLKAADPCDLYFCKRDDGSFEFSVANVQTEDRSTQAVLPIDAGTVRRVVQVTGDGREIPVAAMEKDGRLAFAAVDMRQLQPGARGADAEWSQGYRIEIGTRDRP